MTTLLMFGGKKKSNFEKLKDIENDINLLREEGRFCFDERYNPFLVYYIYGALEGAKMCNFYQFSLKTNKIPNIRELLSLFIDEFKKSHVDTSVLFIPKNKCKDFVRTFRRQLELFFYNGFICGINFIDRSNNQEFIDLLDSIYGIKVENDYDLSSGILYDIVNELIFRYMDIPIESLHL